MSGMSQRVSSVVTTKWLAQMLSQNPRNLRVLDGSWHMPFTKRNPKQEYREKHIQGAQFFGIDDCCDKQTTMDHMIPGPMCFEDYVGKLGINNSTHVVVYDNHPDYGLFSAQRVWWTFRVFGHNLVSVLEDKLESVQYEKFKATFRPDLVKNFEDMLKNLANHHYSVVDARAAGRFHGTHPEPRPEIEPGHMPGSLNIPFMDLLNLETRELKSKEELKNIFKNAGVDLTKPLVGTCGTGISAALLALAAYELGKEDFAVYDGSWTEWYQRCTPEQRTKPQLEQS